MAGVFDAIAPGTSGIVNTANNSAPPGSGSGGLQAPGGVQPPPYVNLNDPVQAAVWQSFAKKGIMPRDQSDFSYWVDHINSSGGLDNGYANAGGTGTWQQRMDAAQGGVGDYGNGGGGGGGSFGGASGGGGGFSFDPNDLASNPTLQFITSRGINALQANKAAQGTVLGTGTGKDLIDYAQQAASQFEPIAYDQARTTFQTNFDNLGQLAGTGFGAAQKQGDYLTQGANAQAAGTVGSANAWGGALNDAGNAVQNASLYKLFNPASAGGGALNVKRTTQALNDKVLGYGNP